MSAGAEGVGWTPANDLERRLRDAVIGGDVAAVMRELVLAPLVLPGSRDDHRPGQSSAVDGPQQRVFTRERDGVPYLLVFTSPEAMHRALAADGWRATTLHEVVRNIPEGWGLAVNPTTPIGVLVAPQDVARLVPTPAAMADFVPANEVERLLRDALVAPDPEVLFDVLVTAQVIAVTQALEFDGVLTVPVFTSTERYDDCLAGRGPAVPTVTLDLVAALREWPGPAYRLAVNPGSPIAIMVRGERVPDLLAHAERLVRRRLGDVPRDLAPPPDDAARPGHPDQPVQLPPGDIADLLRGQR
jgi:hypothetical protein